MPPFTHLCFQLLFLFISFIFQIIVWSDFVIFYFQNRLDITKTIRKFSIDHNLRPTGSGPISHDIKHGEEFDEEPVEGSVDLTAQNFDRYSHM